MYEINGMPLRIDVTSDLGSLSVYRYQPLDSDYIEQYYSTFESYLRLGGTVYGVYGHEDAESSGLVPVSMVQVNPWTVEATVDAGTSGVRILQTISYVNGSPYYTKTWQISNLGSTTYTDVGFLHGGDTYFGGHDSSIGHWEPVLGMVYLTNPDPEIAGIMGFMETVPPLLHTTMKTITGASGALWSPDICPTLLIPTSSTPATVSNGTDRPSLRGTCGPLHPTRSGPRPGSSRCSLLRRKQRPSEPG